MKRNTHLLLLLLAFLPMTSFAQFAEKLETAVTMYNQLRADKTALARDILKQTETCEQLLREVVSGGSTEEQATAQYFLAVLIKVRAEQYFKPEIRDWAKVSSNLKSVVSEFDRLEPEVFPFRYKYEGKNFIVKYPDFVYTRREFYSELAEMYYRESDVANFDKYAGKAQNIFVEGDYFAPYLMEYFGFFLHKTNAEKNQDLQAAIHYYGLMSVANRELVNNGESGTKFIKKNIAYVLSNKVAPVNWYPTGSESLTIANNLTKSGDLDSLAGLLYSQAINKGIVLGYDQQWQVLDLYHNNGFKTAGMTLSNKILTALPPTNCNDLERLAPYFAKFGDATKGAAIQKTAEKCRKDAQDRAEEAERRRQKELRKANRDRVYLGAYVLRMVQRPQYIDLGGTLDIPAGRNTRLEFSYLMARNDQDYMLMERLKDSGEFDSDYKNPHWDGFYAHFGYKKMERPGSRSSAYQGVLLTYNQRNFQPTLTNVVQESTGTVVAYDAPFEPKLTAYGIMFNMGAMWFGNGVGRDFYLGMGATYNLFDRNNDTWLPEQYNFTNPLLGFRKETFISFQIRIGMTIGFAL
jgi:hypothetical protein